MRAIPRGSRATTWPRIPTSRSWRGCSRRRPRWGSCAASACRSTSCTRRPPRSAKRAWAVPSTWSPPSSRASSCSARRRAGAACTSRTTGSRSGRTCSGAPRGSSAPAPGSACTPRCPWKPRATSADAVPAVYEALAKAVPFDGLSLGTPFLAGDLRPGPGVSRIGVWDPRGPRQARAGQDPARLPESARLALAGDPGREPLPAGRAGPRRREARGAPARPRGGPRRRGLPGCPLGRGPAGPPSAPCARRDGSTSPTRAGSCTRARVRSRRCGGPSRRPASSTGSTAPPACSTAPRP